jgi:thiamine kinase-like enzyme
MNGLKYICQEIVSGQPLGKKSQKNFLPFAAGYHNSVQKTKKIKISTVLDAVKNFDIKNDTEYEQVVGLLGQRKDDDIYLAEQHGDLTYKNLIKNEKSVTFIDFENFGLRRVWGEDIIHYLVRMTDMQNRFAENKNVSEILSDFVELTKIYRTKYDLNISDRECGNLFLLDLLFDDLQRTYKKHICLK